jgi:hypothetical protein
MQHPDAEPTEIAPWGDDVLGYTQRVLDEADR